VVNLVVLEVLGRDRFERSGPDVERHPGQTHSLLLQLGQQRLREVQAGGRRGHRTGGAGVDRLVALPVLLSLIDVAIAANIRGQRGESHFLKDLLGASVGVDLEQAHSVRPLLDQLRLVTMSPVSIHDADAFADADLASAFEHHLPNGWRVRPLGQEQAFERGAGLALGEEPRG
jgi:hypothetical protein